MYEIQKGARLIRHSRLETWRRVVSVPCVGDVAVEVGVDDPGVKGKWSRTFIRFELPRGVDITIPDGEDVIEITTVGALEREALVESLEFVLKVIKEAEAE